MKTLIIVEHDNQQVKASTFNTIGAAQAMGGDNTAFVVGHDCQNVATTLATISGVNDVLCADNPVYQHQLAENMAALIVDVAKDYDVVLAPATTFGKNLSPRVAALLDVAQISDITEVIDNTTFVRPIYAGNAFATVTSHDAKKVITVRTTAFDAPAETAEPVSINSCDIVIENHLSEFVEQSLSVSERPELTAATVIVSGGRGMQSGENFSLLEQLADLLNAAIGASRAAVDAGYVANDYQVGQTGKIVAPQLYIAIGISGAIQHLAGMKDSKVIVAINKDEEAPIFQLANYGIVGDLFKIVPEMIELLKQRQS